MSSVMFSASPGSVSAIQSSNRFFIAAAVVVFFVYYSKLMISSPALLQDPDTFWHIVTGQWILNHAQVPTVDFYSYTETGSPGFPPNGWAKFSLPQHSNSVAGAG